VLVVAAGISVLGQRCDMVTEASVYRVRWLSAAVAVYQSGWTV
jgi:hypothetical protein